ncbi:MAG: hypothetical protein RLZZ253_1963 [Verrucomicrobiota bacterium]
MIQLDQIAWKAGSFAFHNLSFTVPQRAYAVLTGPTGQGKTSLLEILCGLRHPSHGRVLLNDTDVTHLPPGARNIGYVPQDAALFPTLTVRKQLAFALELRKRPAAEIQARVNELAAALSITPLLQRKPDGLSGGERQRVALGRALAARPAFLLLDEPLSALDDDTREGLLELLQEIHRSEPVTVLHVTHHREEARRLATFRLHLHNGVIAPC